MVDSYVVMKTVPRNLAHLCLLFRNFLLTSKSDILPSFPGSINYSLWTSWSLRGEQYQLSKRALLHNITEDLVI